jgi:3-dehydroquinate synthase
LEAKRHRAILQVAGHSADPRGARRSLLSKLLHVGRAPYSQPRAHQAVSFAPVNDFRQAMSDSITTETTQLLHTRDAIALPDDPEAPVEATASREDSYQIVVTRSLAHAVERIAEMVSGARVALMTDDRIDSLHGEQLREGLASVGLHPPVFTIPHGEASKSLEEAVRAWHWLAENPLGRRDVLINFGGGVVIDLGGWVASGHTRGMRYLNVPTTLVAQVDAGIGGKVAVNHPRAKNLIGGFCQPLGVVSYVGFIDTLEQRDVNAGIAETIKKALIASPDYWTFIEENADRLLDRDHDAMCRLVGWAGAIKAELIARDPYEADSRRTLGFGHALAHPLETVTGFGPIRHGEAVAFGMSIEARIALARGMLDPTTYRRIIALLRRFDQPTHSSELRAPLDGARLLAATDKVQLARGGFMNWVLLLDVGETVVVPQVSDRELCAALNDAGVDC